MSTPMTVPKIAPRRKRQPLTRSQIMARIRSKNTTPERRVRSAVHAFGLRFRKHANDLPGKPDLANRRRRWVIFVHGCFWHSHADCYLASKPRSNATYWEPKLRGNVERDRRKLIDLERLGYRVFIIWECDTRNPLVLTNVVAKLAKNIQFSAPP
jgi:DNA mismatch endonuclease, patch repair protein